MIGVTQAFSKSYAEARVKFLEAAATAGLAVESQLHPEAGRDGEVLAMDVVRDGPADARSLLIVSSACHGVEGYCGSGVQVFALHDAEWRAKATAQGVAVLYVHALNPYGFSHVRRTTHENVDLNRNFQDFSQPLPVNEAYRELQPLLLPDEWPPTEANAAATGRYISEKGMDAYQAAITRGQHEFPEGLFFGGTAPTWSNRTLRKVLQTYGKNASRVAWIDIHTGLGPSGIGERICACRDDKAALARARAWWDNGGTTPVTSIYDGSSSSAFLTGLMWNSIYEECPDAEYTGIAMEYGTLPPFEMMQALRGEHWLNIHRDAPPALATQIKAQMMDAFYVDTDAWKGQIISQARQSLFQAVDGLSS
ncbi:M14 family metallopeptidase [Polaromonas sp. SM01]|uniref:M14 family metallopeptidase n=1 Tax=Polaromonas sp. SM01 TaxID=3085630 RepID=UPI0029827F17|nr:M14 family metallopeptidase [Polaromonas sp. SM01]MDW5443904.1 M14 family metallopeptidase [Polaromonas sp. SM01]